MTGEQELKKTLERNWLVTSTFETMPDISFDDLNRELRGLLKEWSNARKRYDDGKLQLPSDTIHAAMKYNRCLALWRASIDKLFLNDAMIATSIMKLLGKANVSLPYLHSALTEIRGTQRDILHAKKELDYILKQTFKLLAEDARLYECDLHATAVKATWNFYVSNWKAIKNLYLGDAYMTKYLGSKRPLELESWVKRAGEIRKDYTSSFPDSGDYDLEFAIKFLKDFPTGSANLQKYTSKLQNDYREQCSDGRQMLGLLEWITEARLNILLHDRAITEEWHVVRFMKSAQLQRTTQRRTG